MTSVSSLIGLSAEFSLDHPSILCLVFSGFLEAEPSKFRLGLSHAFFQQTSGLGAINHFLRSKDKAPSDSNQSSHSSSRFQSWSITDWRHDDSPEQQDEHSQRGDENKEACDRKKPKPTEKSGSRYDGKFTAGRTGCMLKIYIFWRYSWKRKDK